MKPTSCVPPLRPEPHVSVFPTRNMFIEALLSAARSPWALTPQPDAPACPLLWQSSLSMTGSLERGRGCPAKGTGTATTRQAAEAREMGTKTAQTTYVNRAGRQGAGPWGWRSPAMWAAHRAAESRLQMCTHCHPAKSDLAGKDSGQMTAGSTAAVMTKDKNRNARHCCAQGELNMHTCTHTH